MRIPMIDPQRGNILDPLVGAVVRRSGDHYDVGSGWYEKMYDSMATSYLPFLNIPLLAANIVAIPASAAAVIYYLANSIISKLYREDNQAIRSLNYAVDHVIICVNLTLNICTLGILNAVILKAERAFNNLYPPIEWSMDGNAAYYAKIGYWQQFEFFKTGV